MRTFLDAVAGTIRKDEHAVMVLDRAGWHGAKALGVPPHVTLVRPPPCSPQLDLVQRVQLRLRERFLGLRVFPDFDAIVDACRHAWNAFADDSERIRSLCLQPRIGKVIGQARRYEPGQVADGRPDRTCPGSLNVAAMAVAVIAPTPGMTARLRPASLPACRAWRSRSRAPIASPNSASLRTGISSDRRAQAGRPSGSVKVRSTGSTRFAMPGSATMPNSAR